MTAIAVGGAAIRPVSARLGRAFTWLWAALGGAFLADGIYVVALPIAAIHVGGGPAGVAVVMTAYRAPWLFASLPAGAIVDRIDRRRLMLAVAAFRVVMLGFTAAMLASATGGVALVVAAAFLMGTCETLFDTSLHSTTPRVVQPHQLERANGRLQATETIARQFAGPSLGGMMAGLAVGFAFGAVALLYLCVILAVWQLRPARGGRGGDVSGTGGDVSGTGGGVSGTGGGSARGWTGGSARGWTSGSSAVDGEPRDAGFRGDDLSAAGLRDGGLRAVRLRGGEPVAAVEASPRRQPVFTAVREGLRFLLREKTLRAFAFGGGLINCGMAAFYTTLPVLLLSGESPKISASGYGLLLAAAGFGGFLTGLAVPALARKLGGRICLAIGSAGLIVGLAAPGFTESTTIVAIGLCVTGLVVLTNVVTVSYRQRVVPDHLLGRVTAAYRLFCFGGLPLGAALAGWIAAAADLRLVFPIAGGLVAIASVAMVSAWKEG